MNQAQRTFLIKKIEESTKTKIAALNNAIPEAPNLEKYLLSAIMSDKFELQSIEHIRSAIIQRVMNLKSGSNFLGDGWRGNKNEFSMPVRDIFVVPDAYEKIRNEYKQQAGTINAQIQEIKVQSESLVTRIQLASDKTLQKMINEVDDMGDVSLMDTRLKMLSSGDDTNKLK